MRRTGNEFEVVIVGPGRAGMSLARAFAESQVSVALIARTPRRARRGDPPILTTDHDRCPRGARFVLLAVPDRAIPEAARTMLEAGVIGPQSLVGHLSGALLSTVLTPPLPAHQVFSAHPLTSFSYGIALFDTYLSGVTVMLEAPDARTARAVTTLFRRARAKVAPVDRDKKPLYHAAAVIGTSFPFLNSMICASILRECGVPDAVLAAGRLMDDALENMTDAKGWEGLTGPFVRGDVETIASNLAALRGFSEEAADLYRRQGRILARMLATANLLGQETWEAIQKTLEA